MSTIKQKHFLILFAVTLFTLVFTGSIDYTNSAYSNMDMNKYIAMATASPELDTTVIRPFVYRIAVPWLVGLLPFSIPYSFYLVNAFALFLLSVVFYQFLIQYGTEENIALLMTVIFQFNRYFFQFLSWNYFQLSDTVSLTLLFYAFILLQKKNFPKLLLLMTFGILVKEYLLMIVPAAFVLLYENKSSKQDFVKLMFIVVLAFLVFYGIRILIPTESGESLLTQYITQLVYYSSPKLLIKRFIFPFAPFALLPIIFYKDLLEFFLKYKHLLIYTLTVIVLSFFGEPERLMAPIVPVFLLFVSDLIDKYLIEATTKLFLNKKVIALLFLSFLVSFYHLWGIIKLPNGYYSLLILVISTLIVSLLFFYSFRKLNRVKPVDN